MMAYLVIKIILFYNTDYFQYRYKDDKDHYKDNVMYRCSK